MPQVWRTADKKLIRNANPKVVRDVNCRKGGCCDRKGICHSNLTPAQCADLGGTYLGDGSGCFGNPCLQQCYRECHACNDCNEIPAVTYITCQLWATLGSPAVLRDTGSQCYTVGGIVTTLPPGAVMIAPTATFGDCTSCMQPCPCVPWCVNHCATGYAVSFGDWRCDQGNGCFLVVPGGSCPIMRSPNVCAWNGTVVRPSYLQCPTETIDVGPFNVCASLQCLAPAATVWILAMKWFQGPDCNSGSTGKTYTRPTAPGTCPNGEYTMVQDGLNQCNGSEPAPPTASVS